MDKRIVTVEPVFKEKMWGGTRIKNEFHGCTSVEPVGEMWCAAALKGDGDCMLKEIGLTLSDAYKQLPEWFDSRNPEFPIRVTLIDPIENLSVQVHPDDAYAKIHDNSQGKPEAWYIVDAPAGSRIQFGHTAKTRDELADKIHQGKWSQLLSYVDAVPGEFLYVPSGAIHAIGKNVLTYEVSRSADLTYRVYDYNRVDQKTGLPRDLHQQKSIDVITVPHVAKGPYRPASVERNGCVITEYFDTPDLFRVIRLEVKTQGTFSYDRFMFLSVLSGNGTIGGLPVQAGTTLLVPDSFKEFELKGKLDVLAASYRESKHS